MIIFIVQAIQQKYSCNHKLLLCHNKPLGALSSTDTINNSHVAVKAQYDICMAEQAKYISFDWNVALNYSPPSEVC